MIINKSSPIPQYFQLQTWLMEQIEQEILKHGVQIPTEKELGEITGLARATIRQAVGNLVNMGYLVRKRRLGTFVRYRQTIKEKQTSIGILIPDIRSGYAPELARGVEDEAAKHKYSLILCNTDDSYLRADQQADRLIDAHVSGAIFVPTATSDEKNRQIVDKFVKNKIPVVLVDRTIPDRSVDHVTTDNYEGALALTEYLINMGHRKIAIILSNLFSTERERLEGYKAALAQHEIPIDPSIMITDGGPFKKNRYRELVQKLLKKHNRYTAIFAGHDRIALLVYSVAKEMGLTIPDDISIVGYDDLPLTTISLTTMHQHIYEMGQQSLNLTLARIRGETKAVQQVVLRSYLVKGESVKALK